MKAQCHSKERMTAKVELARPLEMLVLVPRP